MNNLFPKIDGFLHGGDYNPDQWLDSPEILERDNYICQRCIGHWTDAKYPIKKIKLSKAKYVHHIKPMRDYFELALNDDNLISLCFGCHETVEGRLDNQFKPTKKRLTEEKW